MPSKDPTPEVSAGRVLLLFDVDGTLSPSQQSVLPEFTNIFRKLSMTQCLWDVGVVSGSDQSKVVRQFGLQKREDLLHGSQATSSPLLKYCFFENGVMAYQSLDGHERTLREASMSDLLGADNLKKCHDFVTALFDTLTLPWNAPCKIEQRHATLNVSPIGRACTLEERKAFAAYDEKTKLRDQLAKTIREGVADKLNLEVCAGGQISLDIFPKGWDKSISLDVVHLRDYDQIHFFGDRCQPGGNDYALYNDKRVTHPHAVTGPQDTLHQLQQVLTDLAAVPHVHDI